MPARKISAIGSGKSAGAETAHRRPLPVAVIDNARCQSRLARAGIRQWFSQRTLPCDLGNAVSCPRCHCTEKKKRNNSAPTQTETHAPSRRTKRFPKAGQARTHIQLPQQKRYCRKESRTREEQKKERFTFVKDSSEVSVSLACHNLQLLLT